MNFQKIYDMQKLLDQTIRNTHDIDNQDFIKEKRLVALLVELGEFANEYAPFKYWKKNKIIDESKLIEEFVDGVHFFSSIAIELGATYAIDACVVNEDKSLQLLETFNEVIKLKSEYTAKQLEKSFSLYLGLAKQLNISDKTIEDFYINKNKVNYERIKTNY